jgi:Kef-type K+ transport system membrane component KefB
LPSRKTTSPSYRITLGLKGLAPQVSASLFQGPQTQVLGSLAWLGSVFLLLVAGTEVNLAILIQERRVVAFTSLIGIAVPFTVGLVLGLKLPDTYLVTLKQASFQLFHRHGLIDLRDSAGRQDIDGFESAANQRRSDYLGSAIVNDLVGWILFAIVLSTLNTATYGHGSVLGLVTLTVAFATGCLTIRSKLVLSLF